jgi:hypothetical protein
MKLRWGIGLGLLAMVVAGCDVSVCTKDVDGHCFDAPDYNFDASFGLDASTDGGTRTDGAVIADDGAVLFPDGAVVSDSGVPGIDGGVVPDAGPAVLRIEDFCDAEYRTAKAWRDKLEQCCVVADAKDRELLLENAFFYFVDGNAATGKESVEACTDALKASETAGQLSYVASAAPACVAGFNNQFPPAPTECPAAGFDAETIEANTAHGAQELNQLPACRQAIVGKAAFNAPCGNSFECQDPYRCLGTTGAKTCRVALSRGNPCNRTSECQDGYLCMGVASGSGGRVCYPATEPLETGTACSASTECRTGLLCDDKCTSPQPQLICKQ